jgi:hypothetical protein
MAKSKNTRKKNEVEKKVVNQPEQIIKTNEEEKSEPEVKQDENDTKELDQEQAKQEAEKARKLYLKALDVIHKEVPEDKFKKKENNSGITFFGTEGTRAFKVIQAKKGVKLELNVPVTNVEGLIILSEKEATEKHMGTCRWIYIGDNLDTIKELIKEAVEKYEPKKRADSKEEKDKKEALVKDNDIVEDNKN